MKARDEELSALFADELRRHVLALRRPETTLVEVIRALHAVRGSAGMMGESALSESVGRLEQRARAGDREAAQLGADKLDGVIAALVAGEQLPAARWPVPPADLVPGVPTEDLRLLYWAEMRDRLGHIDEALADSVDAEQALSAIRRHVHAVKGAASAVGDSVAVWFVHGFESYLRDEADKGASALLEEAARMRPILAAIVADPVRALATLRGAPTGGETRRISRPPESTRFRSGAPLDPSRTSLDGLLPGRRSVEEDFDDGSLRVPSAALDRVVERAGALAALVAKIEPEEGAKVGGARELRAARTLIADALRLIGPPRPWGTPAAAIEQLRRASETVALVLRSRENEAVEHRELSERLSTQASRVATDVRALRRTEVSWLFSRVRGSIAAQAARLGRALRIESSGDDLAVDRRVLEQLLDPVLQLAANALVHGMEASSIRAAAAKPEALCLRLDAQLRHGLLRVSVSDDGRGVDVERVRERVLSLGLLDEEAAAAAAPSALLDLLFLPGVSTRRDVTELAGRGIGLDLVSSALQAIGASLRLVSESGRGVTATLDVPIESGLVPVLWVQVGDHRYGLAIGDVSRVAVGRDPGATSLASLVSQPAGEEGFMVVVEPLGHPTFSLAVDGALGIEDVIVRRLPGLVLAAGPYLGAVARADGGLDILLDADALAELSA